MVFLFSQPCKKGQISWCNSIVTWVRRITYGAASTRVRTTSFYMCETPQPHTFHARFAAGLPLIATPDPVAALNQHLGVVWAHEPGPTIGHLTHIALAI
jgi:hypothetical protein